MSYILAFQHEDAHVPLFWYCLSPMGWAGILHPSGWSSENCFSLTSSLYSFLAGWKFPFSWSAPPAHTPVNNLDLTHLDCLLSQNLPPWPVLLSLSSSSPFTYLTTGNITGPWQAILDLAQQCRQTSDKYSIRGAPYPWYLQLSIIPSLSPLRHNRYNQPSPLGCKLCHEI